MEYVKLGNSGLDVSRLCLGCMSYGQSREGVVRREWTLSEEESRPFIQKALDMGINFFDTCDVYAQGESERILGKVVRGSGRRDEVVIGTKIHGPLGTGPNSVGLSRKMLIGGVERCLRNLGTDYVDLVSISRFDYKTPLEETLEALNDVVRAGKVRYIGASSMRAWQFMKALGIQRANGWAQFIAMQNYYNLLYREEEREMLQLCLSEGVGVTPWSPLARGKLTRPWSETAQTDREKKDVHATGITSQNSVAMDKAVVGRLVEVALRLGLSSAQVALAWLLHKPAITSPIVGATKMRQLEDAVSALDVKLSAEDIANLEELYQPHGQIKAFA